LSEDIKRNLYKIHSGGYDLIVGIPRSGMVPAYIIGLYLNVNVIDLDGFIENRLVSNGKTRKSKSDINYSNEAKSVLLVDDSVLSGGSILEALGKIPSALLSKVTTLAIYSDRSKRTDIDLFFEVLPPPRVFEWNLFHRELLSKSCFDIDGVLCVDPTDDENDDGDRYIEFILNARPLIKPTYRINSLVTNRLEKYRPQTELWLKRHEISYDKLIMLDLPSKEARQLAECHASHKANYFKKSHELVLFVESDLSQAREIVKLTGKSVYCMDSNVMLCPGIGDVVTKNPLGFIKNNFGVKRIIKMMIPNWLRPTVTLVYKSIFRKNKHQG
jgi:uncharacterized HAD superfamily protein/hypoxanthine phosphoribosyltransferase